MIRVSLGKLQPGDVVFEKHGRRLTRLGTVASTTKNIAGRHVTVHWTDGGGFSQNWAAHVLVDRPGQPSPSVVS